MPLADYTHWNEDAERIWWEEEGKHAESDAEAWREEEYSAADAFAEECYEDDVEHLKELLADADYNARWPKARRVIEHVLRDRGEVLT
jgi:hypothetical protein